MTPTEQATFDLIREALEKVIRQLQYNKVCPHSSIYDAIDAAKAVSEPQPAGPEDMAIYKPIADGYNKAVSEQPAQPVQIDISAAWVAGYYHAGYTHDGAYANKMSDEYAKEWAAQQPPAQPAGDVETERLNWYELNPSLVISIGNGWYSRPTYGHPLRRHTTIREAIDSAMKGKTP